MRTSTTGVSLLAFSTAVSIVSIGVYFSMSASPPSDWVAADYREVAARLLHRGAASTEGVVEYTEYSFQLQTAQFDALAETLELSQDCPTSGLAAQVHAWAAQSMPVKRDAWRANCAFRAGHWQDTRRRIAEIDTSIATAEAAASAAGAIAANNTTRVTKHSDGVYETTIEDGLTVMRRHAIPKVHPLIPLDITLATWQDAIERGASVPNQEILAFYEDNRGHIVYRNAQSTEGWVATGYAFAPELGWAPVSVRSYDNEGSIMRIVYGFAPVEGNQLARPCAIARGIMREDGEVDVTLWVVDAWHEHCDPALVQLREPTLYLELDFTEVAGDSNAPTAVVREPGFLLGVEPCSKLQTALIHVIEVLGTSTSTADFNFDGVVDVDDIEVVLDRFGSSSAD